MLLSAAWLFPSDLYSTAVWNQGANNTPVKHEPPVTNSTLALNLTKRVDILSTKGNLLIVDSNEPPNYRVEWLFIYWLEFVICWFIIPVLMSFVSLKYAVPDSFKREKFVAAILQNVKFYSICLAGLVVALIYIILSSTHSFSISNIKPLLISLSHLYSLCFTLILLATGIILLPKDLISHVKDSTQSSNNKLFVKLSKTNEELNDSQLSMLEHAREILSTSSTTNENIDVSYNHTLELCKFDVQSLLRQLKNLPNQSYTDLNSNPIISSINDLEKLNNKYNKFINDYYSYVYFEASSDSIIHQLAKSEKKPNIIIRLLHISLAFITTFLSVLLIFLELIPTRWAHSWLFDGTDWLTFLLELTILSYAILTSLYAMSKFKFNNLHVIPNGQSNPINALYYSLYSSRLLFPLCFNLMTLVPELKTKDGIESIKSSFETTLYKDLTFIPMVSFLNKYLPMVFMIAIPLSFKYNLKSKILINILGEEYYYLFFGLMLYEPVSEIRSNDNETNNDGLFNDENTINYRSRINEDYEYCLQDGRYLFERASTHFHFLDNNNDPHNNNSTTTANTDNNNGLLF